MMGRVLREWEERKSCPGNCLNGDLFPCRDDCSGTGTCNGMTRVNLSGSGLRFKIRDCLSYGTLLHLTIEIPQARQGHIHAIGSIVRTRDLIPAIESNASYYSTSMAFKFIDGSDRTTLLEYILHEQRRAIL
jgi:hypothetical protein